MKRFYFRVQKTKQSDLVICVGAPDLQAAEAAANEYFAYPPGVLEWEPLKPEKIRLGMKFEPSLVPGVLESTTGYSPRPRPDIDGPELSKRDSEPPSIQLRARRR
jgi:hypothetical protein